MSLSSIAMTPSALRTERFERLLHSPLGIDLCYWLERPDTLLVFPSQDAADSWAWALVQSGARKAVPLDRFLGREAFLELCLPDAVRAERTLARSADRWLWAASIVVRQLQKPFLRRVLSDSFPASLAAAARIAHLVPALATVSAAHERGAFHPGVLQTSALQEEAEELLDLADKYRDYLAAHSLVDPLFSALSLRSGLSARIYGLAPGELHPKEIEGHISWFDCAVSGSAPLVARAGGATGQQSSTQECRMFETAVDEIEWALGSAARDMARGLEPSDIAISMCGLNPEKAAWIRQISAECGIPVNIRLGTPLLSSTFGRFLSAIADAGRGGLSLRTIDRLVSFKFLTAVNPAEWNELSHTARSAHIPWLSPDRDYVEHLWIESIKTGLCSSETAALYRTFTHDIAELASQTSWTGLYRCLLSFMERWTSTSALSADATTDRSLRLALDELQGFSGRDNSLESASDAPSLFDFYLAYLGSKRYIPSARGNEVCVFDFGTTPGLAALSHYILGASQQGLSFYQTAPLGIPRALADLLDRAVPAGLPVEGETPSLPSDGTAQAMLMFHAQGLAFFSFAAEGFEGSESAPPVFGNAIIPAGEEEQEILNTIPRRAEMALWTAAGDGASSGLSPSVDSTPSTGWNPDRGKRLTASQKARFNEAFSRENAHLRLPAQHYFIPPPLSAPTALRFLTNAGCLADPDSAVSGSTRPIWLVFSPHSLKDRAECAFRWFARRLGLEDTADRDDTNLIIGEFLHRLYRAVTEALPDTGPAGEAEFSAAFDTVLRPVSESLYRERGPGIRPILRAATRKARHRLYLLREFERALCAGYQRAGFEVRLRHSFETAHSLLEGRADCLFRRIDPSTGQTAFILIDYKKRGIPKPSDMRIEPVPPEYAAFQKARPAQPSVRELQVPAYALLLEQEGGLVEGALYWSIEKAEGTAYIRPPAVPEAYRLASAFEHEGNTAEVRSELQAMLVRASEAVAGYRLLDPAGRREFCKDCNARPLCRYWYFLELP